MSTHLPAAIAPDDLERFCQLTRKLNGAKTVADLESLGTELESRIEVLKKEKARLSASEDMRGLDFEALCYESSACKLLLHATMHQTIGKYLSADYEVEEPPAVRIKYPEFDTPMYLLESRHPFYNGTMTTTLNYWDGLIRNWEFRCREAENRDLSRPRKWLPWAQDAVHPPCTPKSENQTDDQGQGGETSGSEKSYGFSGDPASCRPRIPPSLMTDTEFAKEVLKLSGSKMEEAVDDMIGWGGDKEAYESDLYLRRVAKYAPPTSDGSEDRGTGSGMEDNEYSKEVESDDVEEGLGEDMGGTEQEV